MGFGDVWNRTLGTQKTKTVSPTAVAAPSQSIPATPRTCAARIPASAAMSSTDTYFVAATIVTSGPISSRTRS